MPTYTYDERMKVVKAMEASGAATCPRCGAAIETHRLQTTQDKVLKRPGRPLYRCANRACACECTAPSHMTIPPAPAPLPPSSLPPSSASASTPTPPSPPRPPPTT